MSVTIAMSIDYSLFLLSRYREEVERNTHGSHGLSKFEMIKISRDAIRQTTRWSGKVIALSGCILSLTYFGLIFYPMEVLQSVGLGAGLAIVCTILVNLTLTPALLLIFPYFFSQFGWAGCPCKRIFGNNNNTNENSCWKSASEPLIVNAHNGIIEDSNSINRSNNNNRISNIEPINMNDDGTYDLYAAVNKNDPCEKCWYFCGSKTTICPWSVLISVIVYASIAPIGWQFTTFKRQLADTLIFPRDSDYYYTYTDVVADFSAGFIAPWYILIYKNDDQPKITSTNYSDYIKETGYLISEVYKNITNQSLYNMYNLTIEGLGFIGTNAHSLDNPRTNISYGVINETIWNNTIACVNTNCTDFWNKYKKNIAKQKECYECQQINQTYYYLVNNKISDDGTSSYYQMTTLFDPYYEHAIQFVSDFRDCLTTACNKYGYNCYLSGGSIDEVDSVNKIYSNFPLVLGKKKFIKRYI